VTERLCPSPGGGCEEPVQRAEQPHGSCAEELAETLSDAPRDTVIVAGQGLADPVAPGAWLLENPGGAVEAWRLLRPLQRRALAAAQEPPSGLRAVVEALRQGRARRLIYAGVDGAAARLAPPGSVLELYGSVLRGRCPRCGRRVELNQPAAGSPRCPGCGAVLEPDLVWAGERPRQRVLGEAVYEATTAGLLVTCCLGAETLTTILALASSRFTKLVTVCERLPRARG